MKLPELISKLQALQEEHGDIEVVIYDKPSQSAEFVVDSNLIVRWLGFNQEWYEPWNDPFVREDGDDFYEKVVALGAYPGEYNPDHLV